MIRSLKTHTDIKFPPIGDTLSKNVREMTALLKIELTGTNKAWYVVEYDGSEECFGFFIDKSIEPRYFKLEELNQLETSKNKIKIDLNFEPITISKVLVEFWYEEWGL